MGICCSCIAPRRRDTINETTPLLSTFNEPPPNTSTSEERNAELNRIVQETQQAFINVASLNMPAANHAPYDFSARKAQIAQRASNISLASINQEDRNPPPPDTPATNEN